MPDEAEYLSSGDIGMLIERRHGIRCQPWRINHALQKLNIKACGRVGRTRLYRQADAETVAIQIKRWDRERREAPELV